MHLDRSNRSCDLLARAAHTTRSYAHNAAGVQQITNSFRLNLQLHYGYEHQLMDLDLNGERQRKN